LGILAVVGVGPGMRCLNARRLELMSFPVAARWILERTPKPRAMTGSLSQVAYLCGCRHFYSGETRKSLEASFNSDSIDYYVYSEKDLQGRPDQMEMIRSWDRLEPPVEIQGPANTLRVYIQRVR
jgi:hypothetical protein